VEHVLLKTEDKVEVSGKFYLPKGKDRVPAAILVHAPGGEGESLKDLAESLQKRGLAVLVPDLRGHGTSVREDMDWSKLDAEGQARLWAFAARDLEACAEWLRSRSDIHTSNLTLIGVLGGCTLAAHHAVRDENARALVLISPQPEELGFNVLGDLRELGGLPTLVIAEKAADESCRRMCEAGHKANGGSEYIEVKVLKSEREDLLHHRKLKAEITGWLREQVMPRRGK
jgi:dienelactone hydrolase